jgi:hypothetical protein
MDAGAFRPAPIPVRPPAVAATGAGGGRWDGWLGIAVRAERDSVLSGCAVNEDLEGFLIS